MAAKKISELPAGTANASAVVPATNAAGTLTEKVTLGAIAALGGGAPAAHASSHSPGGSDAIAAGSEGNQGTLYLASVAEAVTGTDTAKAVTAQGAALARRGSGRSKLWEIFTDFNGYQSSTVGASGGDGILWYPNVSNVTLGDTGYYTNSSGTDYRSGVLGLTSSTSGGYATFSFAGASGSISANCHRWDTGTTVAEAMVYMSALATASNDFIVRFGFLGAGSTAATTTGGNWIEYNRANSDYWQGCTYTNPTTTRTTSILYTAATGWTRLTLEIASDGTITFKVNGSALESTLSAVSHASYTNRPLMLGLAFNKTSTNSASVYWDYVYASHVFTADRT